MVQTLMMVVMRNTVVHRVKMDRVRVTAVVVVVQVDPALMDQKMMGWVMMMDQNILKVA
jgi:hypothetical protein